ncbi:MAG: hypothetical protein ACREA0_27900, partial [bacterium]
FAEPRAPAWNRIVEASGSNACDSPLGEVLILRNFNVDHARFFVNYTITMDAGVVDFELADPFSSVKHSRRFSASGSDTVDVQDPLPGIWEWRVNCPAAVRVNLEWNLVVEALSRG